MVVKQIGSPVSSRIAAVLYLVLLVIVSQIFNATTFWGIDSFVKIRTKTTYIHCAFVVHPLCIDCHIQYVYGIHGALTVTFTEASVNYSLCIRCTPCGICLSSSCFYSKSAGLFCFRFPTSWINIYSLNSFADRVPYFFSSSYLETQLRNR